MKRLFGAVLPTLRGIARKARPSMASAKDVAPKSVHQEKVRKAMEALAPKGAMLPSENRALTMEIAAAMAGGDDVLNKTPDEMFLAANALFQGTHLPQDKAKASELWKAASDAGHVKATYSYAGCLRNGDGIERDIPMAMELFERLGKEGLLEAKHALGLMLSSGEGSLDGVPQDEPRARELFKSAAIGGFVPAIHAAASMMEGGKGGDKEEAKATQWLEVGIEAGDPMAASTLATWYQDGRGGLEVDHEKAYELHLSAAKRGMPRAQYNTAVQLFEGKGVKQNLPEAAAWFEVAAAAGVPQAMLNLGKMLEQGLGVERDQQRALEMYKMGLRAEGQLDGAMAKVGEAMMEKILAESRGDEANSQGNDAANKTEER